MFAPLAAPGASVAGAAAPDLAQMQNAAAAPGPAMQFQWLQPQQKPLYTPYAAAAPGPSVQFQSLQPQDSKPYTSFATTNRHTILGGGERPVSPKCGKKMSGTPWQSPILSRLGKPAVLKFSKPIGWQPRMHHEDLQRARS